MITEELKTKIKREDSVKTGKNHIRKESIKILVQVFFITNVETLTRKTKEFTAIGVKDLMTGDIVISWNILI